MSWKKNEVKQHEKTAKKKLHTLQNRQKTSRINMEIKFLVTEHCKTQD